MEAITPTCDRKTKFWNAQKNTFGTMPGPDQTCPGATIGEGGCWTRPGGRKTHTCYVDAVLLCYKAVGPVLAKNTKVLKQATQTEMFDILCREFSRFQKAEFGRFDRTGEMPQLYYRLHWAGDMFNHDYAKALADATRKFKNIKFWTYTRTFSEVKTLLDIPNLMVYLSLDKVNVREGIKLYGELNGPLRKNLCMCYLGKENDFNIHAESVAVEVELNDVLKAAIGAEVPDYNWLQIETTHRVMACPTDEKKLAVDGACKKCRRCLNGNNIWFKTK